MKRLSACLGGIVLVAGLIAAALGINAVETPKALRIIYTNDLTGYIEPCG